jgi:hypothetical protein
MKGSYNVILNDGFDCWFWDMTKLMFFCLLILCEMSMGHPLRRSVKDLVPRASWNVILNPERRLLVLGDAISCMNLVESPSHFCHSDNQRIGHFRELSVQINMIVDYYRHCTVGFRRWCWAGVCTETLEDIWASFANCTMSMFGPFLPLVVPWNRLWGYPAIHAPCYQDALADIWFFLRSDFLYVTISQNSQGIEGISYFPVPVPRNILVLSSGGKGHIPVLLWLKEFTPVQFAIAENYTYDLVFMGNLASHWTRKVLTVRMLTRLHDRAYVSVGKDWPRIYNQSKFILCPRGFGRNSYRLGEVLQMGMLPVFVYNDFIWLPYYGPLNWSEFAIITRYDKFGHYLDRIANTSPNDARRMRVRIRELFPTHFSPQAVWRHIFAFLDGGFRASDLRCAPYTYTRDLQQPDSY